MKLTNSEALVKRALKVFPSGANTISKFPKKRSKYPVIRDAQGSVLWDEDGNEYIDWTAGLGAVVLGYDYVFKQDNNCGNLLSSVTEDEILLAEKLVEIIPCAEQVRFFKTGSECTSAAIRLAMSLFGSTCIFSGYHGWHDWYAYHLPSPKNNGCDSNCNINLEYGNLESLRYYIKKYEPACFILEPINRIYPEKANPEYLKEVRRLCTKYNVLLIFDEIISGFRYDIGGISTLWDIEPDLACYSKAMANGYPIAALVGKEKYMKHFEDIHVSGTFNGERKSIVEALNTIEVIEKDQWFFDELRSKGFRIATYLRDKAKYLNFVDVKFWSGWFKLVWKDEAKRKKFYDCVLENGVYSMDDHFIMYCHTEEQIDKTLEVYEKGFKEIK